MDLTLLIIFFGIFLGFLMQTVAGFSGSIVSLPILFTVLEVKQAVGLMAILLFFFSAILIYQNRKLIDKKFYLEAVIFTLPGVLLGIYLISFGSPDFLKKALGIFMIAYVIISIFEKNKFDFIKNLGIPVSLFAGIFSGMFAVGGGLFIMYLRTRIKHAPKLRATMLAILGTNNIVRLPILTYTGVVTWDSLHYALISLPVLSIAIFLGSKVFKKIDDSTFNKIILGLLFAGGVSLLFT